MVEVVGVAVAAAFGELREHDGAERSRGVASAFVPRNDNGAAIRVSARIHDFRDFVGQPGVAHQDAIRRGTTRPAMHVVAEVRRDEIIARHGVVREIARQFTVGPDVVRAIGRVEVNVVEINERVMECCVESTAGGRTCGAADAFLIRLPANARVLKLNHEMIRRCEMM